MLKHLFMNFKPTGKWVRQCRGTNRNTEQRMREQPANIWALQLFKQLMLNSYGELKRYSSFWFWSGISHRFLGTFMWRWSFESNFLVKTFWLNNKIVCGSAVRPWRLSLRPLASGANNKAKGGVMCSGLHWVTFKTKSSAWRQLVLAKRCWFLYVTDYVGERWWIRW